MREVLKEEGVGYLNLAGNFYLNWDDFYVEKIVDKNPFLDYQLLLKISSK